MKTQIEVPANVQLIDRQPVHVAYLRRVGSYGAPLLQFWGDVVYPWMVTNSLLGRPRYGISLDDPGITSPDKCRYDACVEVEPEKLLTGQAQRTTIAGGRYAAMKFFGTTADITAAWNSLLRDWVPQSGLQLDDRLCFEYYPVDARWDEKTGRFGCELCIPVAPL